MKKRLSIFLCLFTVIIMSLSVPAFAKNNVSSIDVDVCLNNDGSAVITQVWKGSFSEGTECYIPIENLGEMEIKDFMVSGESGTYENIGKWNIDASFNQKANKCGIVKTDNGYELCFGIGQYGDNKYTVQYTLTKLVGSYSDLDGFNHQFIGSGMSTFPTDVTVKIRTVDGTPLNDGNSDIWAFGFNGDIGFQADGTIFAQTTSPLTGSSESVIIMLGLNKGVFYPTRQVSGSFESVKERAFKGSDYNTDSSNQNDWIPFLLIGAMLLVFAIIAFVYIKNRMDIKKMYNEAGYCRDVPIDGNLEAVYHMGLTYHQNEESDSIISAAFLKMIMDGNLEPLTETSARFFGGDKENISLKIVSEPKNPSVTVKALYDLLLLASGSDRILQEKELSRYCKTNYEATTQIMQSAKNQGEISLGDLECFNGKSGLKGLTQRGKELLSEVMGFKKYLLDFSLIGERTVNEAVIWQDYLVFASVLGIADKALEQLKKLYPENLERIMPYSYNDMSYFIFISARYNTISYRAAAQAAQAARSGGSGGAASFGGGGGFSGGGGGGGTR